MRKKILISRPIREHSPESLLDFVKKLYKRRTESKESKAVPGITIHLGKRVIVKLKDKERIFNDEEIKLLALEYSKEIEEIMEILLSRKIKIINAKGELYESETRSKGNVKPQRKKRKKTDKNELLQSGPSVDLFSEGTLPTQSES